MKFCSGCGETRPAAAFYDRANGLLSSKCKPCVAQVVKARQWLLREQKLAQMEPWQREHAERQRREQDARRAAKEYRKKLPNGEGVTEGHKRCPGCAEVLPLAAFLSKTGHRQFRCKPCVATYAREQYHKKHVGAARYSTTPEGRSEIATRINRIVALLAGTAPGERISDDDGWDMTTAELSRLWPLSGDKHCIACGKTVPAPLMHAPGPANFYPGKCKPCVRVEYDRRTIAIYRHLPSPRLLPMLDGSEITIGELARHHREREARARREPVTSDS